MAAGPWAAGLRTALTSPVQCRGVLRLSPRRCCFLANVPRTYSGDPHRHALGVNAKQPCNVTKEPRESEGPRARGVRGRGPGARGRGPPPGVRWDFLGPPGALGFPGVSWGSGVRWDFWGVPGGPWGSWLPGAPGSLGLSGGVRGPGSKPIPCPSPACIGTLRTPLQVHSMI